MRKTASSQTCGWENWDLEGNIDQSRVTPPCQRGFDLPGPRFKFAAPALSYCLFPLRACSSNPPGAPPLRVIYFFSLWLFFFSTERHQVTRLNFEMLKVQTMGAGICSSVGKTNQLLSSTGFYPEDEVARLYPWMELECQLHGSESCIFIAASPKSSNVLGYCLVLTKYLFKGWVNKPLTQGKLNFNIKANLSLWKCIPTKNQQCPTVLPAWRNLPFLRPSVRRLRQYAFLINV